MIVEHFSKHKKRRMKKRLSERRRLGYLFSQGRAREAVVRRLLVACNITNREFQGQADCWGCQQELKWASIHSSPNRARKGWNGEEGSPSHSIRAISSQAIPKPDPAEWDPQASPFVIGAELTQINEKRERVKPRAVAGKHSGGLILPPVRTTPDYPPTIKPVNLYNFA